MAVLSEPSKCCANKRLTKEELRGIKNEAKIIKGLDHPNIVKIYAQYQDHKFLYIVTEFIEGGELFDELIRRKKFSEADCASIIKQLLEALSYCHAKNIVHKDLKPENILLEKKKDIESIKLIDFGTAQKFEIGKKMTTVIGTPYYVAPEVLKGSYDEKCDVWGVGVIMFILLSGVPPFNGPDDDAIMKAVVKGNYKYNPAKWKGVSKHAKDLIDQMLVLDPNKRISAQDALEHKWMTNFNEGTINKKSLTGALKNIKTYRAEQIMKKAALSYIVSQLATKDDTKELAKAFKKLDVNHDGILSEQELIDGCHKVYPEMTKSEVLEQFKEIDVDNSGGIDYSEWIAATINKKKIISESNLKSAFNLFDADGDGMISVDEIKKILGDGSQIEEAVREIDQNGDGFIDFDEFRDMMKNFGDE